MSQSGQDSKGAHATSVWVADAAGRFVGEAPGSRVAEALAPHVRRVARAGQAEHVLISVHLGAAGVRTMEAALQPFELEESRGVAIALSERRTNDAYNLARFELVLDATREGVWEWVVADGSVWWNERANEIFGYSPGSVPNFERWTSRIHPDDRERVLSGYMAAVHDGHACTWEDEYRVRRVDGELRYVLDHARVERDANGQAIRLVGVMSDVTEKRVATAARAEMEQQFRQMAETIMDVMWLADATTLEILYVSPAFERIFGRPKSDLVGRHDCLFLAVHPDDRARVAERMPELRSGGFDETYRIVRPDGKVRWIRERVVPVLDEHGKVVRLAGLSSDETAHRQLEEQLLQARKMESVGRLAGGVAHDFNNLLTVILASSDFALRRLPEAHAARADIEQVGQAAERAVRLTQQLLAFARRQVIAPVRLDVNELTRQMDALLRRVIGEHIELVTRLAPDLHPVLADPSQLEQVLVNLAVNARDAMAQGGQLTLETRNVRVDEGYREAHAHVAVGDYAMLAVTDTGTGMPRDVQEHVFEPFFTTKAKGGGTGLGLATCYGIIRQAGGQILIDSELGRGTTFKILLPATNVEPRPAAQPSSAPPPGGQETIVFVEDDASVRGIGIRILAEQGYHVLEAASGAQALQVAAEHAGPIHLLITDLVMPQMSGTDLARRLREQRPKTRVLYTSGYAENAIAREAPFDPALAFLPKPYIAETLLFKVRSVLEGKS